MAEMDSNTIQRVLRATRQIEMMPPQLCIPRRKYPVGGGGGVKLARITYCSPIPGCDSRWLYSLRRVGIGAAPMYEREDIEDTDFATIESDPAINLLEVTNVDQHAGTQGDGVNQYQQDPAEDGEPDPVEPVNDYPETFYLKPVGNASIDGGEPENDTIVEYWRMSTIGGDPVWVFSEVNPHNGTCA